MTKTTYVFRQGVVVEKPPADDGLAISPLLVSAADKAMMEQYRRFEEGLLREIAQATAIPNAYFEFPFEPEVSLESRLERLRWRYDLPVVARPSIYNDGL